MGTYADSLLTDGEVVLRREHQHWLSLFLESRLSIFLWIVGIIALAAILLRPPHNPDAIDTGISWGALIIIVAGIALSRVRAARPAATDSATSAPQQAATEVGSGQRAR